MGAYDWVGPALKIGGALYGAYSANKAANQQADAASAAASNINRLQERAYSDAFPYRNIGQNALYQLASGLGAEYEGAPGSIEDRYKTALNRFQQSPGYQFAFDQGVQAIDRGAAASGLLNSGATAKALQRFGTGLALQDYGNYQNRLAALAGIGQTATGESGRLGVSAAGGAGQYGTLAGTARASGTAGVANQVNQGITNLLS